MSSVGSDSTAASKTSTAGACPSLGKSRCASGPNGAVSTAAAASSSTSPGLVLDANPIRPSTITRSATPLVCRALISFSRFASKRTGVSSVCDGEDLRLLRAEALGGGEDGFGVRHRRISRSPAGRAAHRAGHGGPELRPRLSHKERDTFPQPPLELLSPSAFALRDPNVGTHSIWRWPGRCGSVPVRRLVDCPSL